MLVKQRGALDEILTNAPLALNNLYLTYNPQAGTLDTRANLGEIVGQLETDPAAFLCGIVSQADTLRRRSATRSSTAASPACAPGRARSARADRAGRAGPLRPDPRRTRGGGAMKRARASARSLVLAVGAAR